MQDLKVTLVQADLVWEDVESNLSRIGELLTHSQSDMDLIVLPEMFSTGFTMRPELFYEQPGGKTFETVSVWAEKYNASVMGSWIVKENGCFYNRLHVISPHGLEAVYDKKHLFRMGQESEHYSAGSRKKLVLFRGWRILPLICYDLRFPVWSRNRLSDVTTGYDLLIYVANWPARRSAQWKKLLQARAIENQVYCIGVNRTGVDGNAIPHSGDTLASDFLGEPMNELTDSDTVINLTLSYDKLGKFRSDFPAWKDADEFELK